MLSNRLSCGTILHSGGNRARLKTCIYDDRTLPHRNPCLGVLLVEVGDVQARRAYQQDENAEQGQIRPQAARVRRGLSGGVEEGADDVSRRLSNEEYGVGALLLSIAGGVLG